MQNKKFRSGPIAITTTTTTNLLNPPTATGGVNGGSSPCYILVRHVRVVNTTAASINLVTFLGATGANAAGTSVLFGGAAAAGALTQGQAIPANSAVDIYTDLRLDSTDFLVGGASATGLNMTIVGEIGVAG
jgi:hypothetical protein